MTWMGAKAARRPVNAPMRLSQVRSKACLLEVHRAFGRAPVRAVERHRDGEKILERPA